MSVRRPAARPDPPGADAAARRLALIAADLGVTAPTVPAATAPALSSVSSGPSVSSAPSVRGPEGAAEPWWADHTRVAAAVDEAASPVTPEPVPPERARSEPAPEVGERAPALPRPGRHAARGRRERPDARVVLAPLADRLPALGTAQVAVVAIAVALGLAVTTWWVLRDRTQPLAPVAAEPTAPLVAATGADPAPAAGEASAPATTTETVTVDVAGKVRRPGIVVLETGARVTDALEAAGGPRKGVDLTSLNLARVLVDGEQIVVGAPASAAAPSGTSGAGGAGAGAPGGALVNLNTAGQAELESLPQVGPVTAQAIIAWREAHGGFTRVDELLEVDGIGAKTLQRLTPHVTV
ncbi:helix-hairpin-helix domain-containing protein [Nocardioides humi]|uniref:Helix-hairpin-helix DNA-binding motif class 1 domain-containing protein n=1 Tax=Nocardioides humi TaxID=449461 RepID=A0ABN2BSA2_9ACTN|nr:helix-hairpin-helix domain-containing protein [Nocardioides humi]